MVLISLVPRCVVILWFGCCALGFYLVWVILVVVLVCLAALVACLLAGLCFVVLTVSLGCGCVDFLV